MALFTLSLFHKTKQSWRLNTTFCFLYKYIVCIFLDTCFVYDLNICSVSYRWRYRMITPACPSTSRLAVTLLIWPSMILVNEKRSISWVMDNREFHHSSSFDISLSMKMNSVRDRWSSSWSWSIKWNTIDRPNFVQIRRSVSWLRSKMVETFRNNGEESVLNLFKLKTYLLVQLVSLQMHIADIIIYYIRS